MIQIKILAVGKAKEPWIEAGIAEFTARLSGQCKLTCDWVTDDAQLLRQLAKERCVVLLDPSGKPRSSEEFAKWLTATLVAGGARLTFVIGGADGLPAEAKAKCPDMISLSPLTFTHQMVRLILAEQVYRAFEINRGSPYHR